MTSEPPEFQPGEFVALVHTADPYTSLRRGTRGRVVRATAERLNVEWEDGSTLSMLPGEGDVVERAWAPDVFEGDLWAAAADVHTPGGWRPATSGEAHAAAMRLGWHHEYSRMDEMHLVSPTPAQAESVERKGRAEFHVSFERTHVRFVLEMP